MLYLCATPIGNLEDITLRVLNTLKNVDLILAEDTRHSAVLLNHYEIKKPMLSFHKFSDRSRIDEIVQKLKDGMDIALISDAGTPCISDPGYELVAECIKNDLEFTSLPGATAFTTALTLSGLDTRKFLFLGFLPQKKSAADEILENVKRVTSSLIFYEAPHRLLKTLNILYSHLGERRVSLCRELTKIHESVMRTTLTGGIEYYESNTPKGEFVIVLEGYEQQPETDFDFLDEYNRYLSENVDRKEAIRLISKRAGVPKREVYNIVNNIK